MAGGDDDYGKASRWERRLSLYEPTCYQPVPSQCSTRSSLASLT